ncbi:tyrosine-type recombinase/integrase [Sinorhizobium meliloti]|nr:tyrosine-type recombinase/integrase [Sinorhizobium meliloti]
MATIHMPNERHIPPGSRMKEYIPYIIAQEGDYPDGVNYYIYDRCRGKIDPSDIDKPRTKLKQLAQKTIHGIAHKMCDLLTWAESEEAHPGLGRIPWFGIKRWHIEGPYLDAMRRGYWSQRYWQTGIPHGLHPTSTIAPKINEQLLCFRWMERQGYIEDFDIEPAGREILASVVEANINFASKASADDGTNKKQQFRRTRKRPGDGVLPDPEHMLEFFSTVSPVTSRKAVINMFEWGWRIEENRGNTLLPGVMHRRDVSAKNRDMCHHSWTDEPRLLKYSLNDDAMIGVLPDRAVAFSDSASLSMRIIGKGRKVRLTHGRAGWVQSLWSHADGPRREILRRNGIARGDANAYLFIDRDGKPLTTEALSKAITRANDRLKTPFRITAHTCRHLHACYFLKNHIEARAAEAGLSVGQLTHEQLYQIAELPARALQLHMGHAFFEDTETYIEMLIHSWLAPQYYGAWNAALDGFDDL